jgi:hypothetical protein
MHVQGHDARGGHLCGLDRAEAGHRQIFRPSEPEPFDRRQAAEGHRVRNADRRVKVQDVTADGRNGLISLAHRHRRIRCRDDYLWERPRRLFVVAASQDKRLRIALEQVLNDLLCLLDTVISAALQ